MNCLVFDIETVPDVELGRRLLGLDELSDEAVAKAMFARQRAASGHEFLPHLQQRVVAIACALRTREQLSFWSLGEPQSSEAELLRRFFEGIEKFSPELISWNGGGFDLPVLHYRGLVHGVRAGRYWDMGDDNKDFRWNNYISRYHPRHCDLMDLLALYQSRANAPLSDLAQLAGLPGKLGMSGAEVWDAYQAGKLPEIRNYCETDVVNTYLLHLRFQLMRGSLDDARYRSECDLVRATLGRSTEPHWKEFLEKWRA